MADAVLSFDPPARGCAVRDLILIILQISAEELCFIGLVIDKNDLRWSVEFFCKRRRKYGKIYG